MIVKLKAFLKQNSACPSGTRLAARVRSRQMIDVWDLFVTYSDDTNTLDGTNSNSRSYHVMRYRRWFAFMLANDIRVPSAVRRSLKHLATSMLANDYLNPTDEQKLRALVVKAWAYIK